MKQDEIIEIAKKAGIPTGSRFVGGEVVECLTIEVEAFAKLVEERAAAKERKEMAEHCFEITRMAVDKAVSSAIEKEREECAKVCDEFAKDSDWPTADNCAETIRARGEA